jgi:hypothetical protein
MCTRAARLRLIVRGAAASDSEWRVNASEWRVNQSA